MGYPQIIQRTILVLKPMVLGISHFGKPPYEDTLQTLQSHSGSKKSYMKGAKIFQKMTSKALHQ